jgi:hypothetical protein
MVLCVISKVGPILFILLESPLSTLWFCGVVKVDALDLCNDLEYFNE